MSSDKVAKSELVKITSERNMSDNVGKSPSRIEITSTVKPNNVSGGNISIYGPGNYNVKTTVSKEATRFDISSDDGVRKTVSVPSTSAKPDVTYEKRIIVEGNNETVEEYENGVLIRKTVNGRDTK